MVLLVASTAKFHTYATDPAGASEGATISGHPELQGALIGFEWIFGLWLLTDWWPRATRLLSLLTFSAFAVAAAAKAAAGASSCGCFGAVRTDPRLTAALDVFLVVAILRHWRTHAVAKPSRYKISTLMIGVLSASVSIPAAMYLFETAWGRGHVGEKHAFTPRTSIGKTLPFLEDIDVGARLGEGQWSVLLYRSECGACRSILPVFIRRGKDMEMSGLGMRSAIIELSGGGPGPSLAEHGETSCLQGRFTNHDSWEIRTPSVIRLENGRVISIKENPSPSDLDG